MSQNTSFVQVIKPDAFKVEHENTIKKEVKFKRQRSENWCHEDKELLKDLIKKRVKQIENKNTDSNTNQTKKSFNSLCLGKKRNVPQLKSQWSTIKMLAKKEFAEYRAKAKQTGGGEPPTEVALSGNDISVWLPNEFVIDTNEFDSDFIINDNESVCESCGTVESVKSVLSHKSDEKDNKIGSMKRKRKEEKSKISPLKKMKVVTEKNNIVDENVMKIANNDTECRKELHLLQIEAEKRIRNLNLEFELIQARLNFYKKKSFGDIEI